LVCLYFFLTGPTLSPHSTLSLHDALPILADRCKPFREKPEIGVGCERFYLAPVGLIRPEELLAGWGLLESRGRKVEVVHASEKRSEEHTSELQSPCNLVCRLLLEKKKKNS